MDDEALTGIMLCVTVTDDVLQQAIDNKCRLILSHHQPIFKPLKNIQDPLYLKAISNGIQICSAHANLDKMSGGTTDTLATSLGLRALTCLNDFVVASYGEGCAGRNVCLLRIMERLNRERLRVIDNRTSAGPITNIAVCVGSGGNFIEEVGAAGINMFITGDIGYHAALSAKNMVVVDIGHFHSEKYVPAIFTYILKNLEGHVALHTAIERGPITIYEKSRS